MTVQVGLRLAPLAVRERRLGDQLPGLRLVRDLTQVVDLLGEDALVRTGPPQTILYARESLADLRGLTRSRAQSPFSGAPLVSATGYGVACRCVEVEALRAGLTAHHVSTQTSRWRGHVTRGARVGPNDPRAVGGPSGSSGRRYPRWDSNPHGLAARAF